MTGSVALDVVIGLVFVYLLYSLFASILFEGISDSLRLRNRNLEQYLFIMLSSSPTTTFLEWWFPSYARRDETANLASTFLQFRTIRQLTRKRGWFAKTGPSYIEPETFSKALMEVLADNQKQGSEAQNINACLDEDGVLKVDEVLCGGTIKSEPQEVSIDDVTKKHLSTLWKRSSGDLQKFKSELEEWYQFTMDRSASNFKQVTQKSLLFIGIVLAASFNVDTLSIAEKLSKNSEARAQILVMATKASNGNESVDTMRDQASEQIKDANEILGLGWGQGKPSFAQLFDKRGLKLILGWLITGFAISLGAPFWFDMLNKLIKLRSALPQSKQGNDKKQGNSAVPTTERHG